MLWVLRSHLDLRLSKLAREELGDADGDLFGDHVGKLEKSIQFLDSEFELALLDGNCLLESPAEEVEEFAILVAEVPLAGSKRVEELCDLPCIGVPLLVEFFHCFPVANLDGNQDSSKDLTSFSQENAVLVARSTPKVGTDYFCLFGDVLGKTCCVDRSSGTLSKEGLDELVGEPHILAKKTC